MLNVVEITNRPIPSMCYVAYSEGEERGEKCAIVDPGTLDNAELFGVLDNLGLTPEAVILTHEHFDHCAGVNGLKSRFPGMKVITSAACAPRLANPKKNFSYYYNPDEAFAIEGTVECVDLDNGEISGVMLGREIRYIPAPGHTKCSMAVEMGGYLFTGDAYLPRFKTVTNLPTGNKESAAQSVAMLMDRAEKKGLTICPGHREAGTIEI